ncbi:hypothetical protein DFH27DRAFT_191763 [Peziza echinospora]|nr:hypothetical protein DFH27DRAFT_191763 [Peziza echinospora]
MCEKAHKPSIILTHLNADSTFLVSYLPFQHSQESSNQHQPFTVLIDPWLTGNSPILHPKFLSQVHTTASSISHLSHLPHPPNLVLLSQANTDHCHRETLRGLPPTQGGTILGVSGAIRNVRRWKIGKGEGWKTGVLRSRKKVTMEIPLSKNGRGECGCIPSKASVDITYHPARWPWELPSLHSALEIVFETEYTTIHSQRDGVHGACDTTRDSRTIVCTPHGLRTNAFPRIGEGRKVDVLLHPFTRVRNHWLMGGDVVMGIENVLRIMRGVGVQSKNKSSRWRRFLCFHDSSGVEGAEKSGEGDVGIKVGILVSAHDETKALAGLASNISEYFRIGIGEVESRIGAACSNDSTTKVWVLESGEARECIF